MRVAAIVLGAAAIELAGSGAYYLLRPSQEREAVERLLGLRRGAANEVVRFSPHPYFNFVNNPDFTGAGGTRLHSPAGLRSGGALEAERRPGVPRIAALGGSTTYGYYYDDAARTWPALLEGKLRQELGTEVEVINAGVPAHTTYETLGVASMWLPEWRPDLVLLLVGFNDAFTVGYPDEGGPDNTRFRHAWDYRPLSGWARMAMRASRTLRLAGMAILSRRGQMTGDATAAMQRPLPPAVEIDAHVRAATGKYFRRNLLTLVALARRAGAEPVLLTNPLNPAKASGLGPYYDAVSAAVERNNRIIREVGKEERVAVIDLHARVAEERLFWDAAHANDEGMEVTARTVFEQLLPRVRTALRSVGRKVPIIVGAR